MPKKSVIGVVALTVALGAGPVSDELPVVAVARHRHPDDTGAEHTWQQAVDGPVNIANQLAAPLAISVTSAGRLIGGRSEGTAAVTITELGMAGERFDLVGIDLRLLTHAVRFTGVPILTAPDQLDARATMSLDRRAIAIAFAYEAARFGPAQVTVAGLGLEADTGVPDGCVVALEIHQRSRTRVSRNTVAGSPGVVEA